MELKNTLTQKQTLHLTPQLQQAIKLLQLSNLELSCYLEDVVAGNPLLNLEPGDWSSATATSANETTTVSEDDFWGYQEREESNQPQYEARPQLLAYLIAQINHHFHSPEDKDLAILLLEYLNPAGYLDSELETIAAEHNLLVPQLEIILQQLQGFDPPGVFARNLSECLWLQLRSAGQVDASLQELLRHLDYLGQGKVEKLQKLCKLSRADLQQKVQELRQLTACPVLEFEAEVPHSIHPDLIAVPDEAQHWRVGINHDTLPQVSLDKNYYSQVTQQLRHAPELKYIRNCYNQGAQLISALNQRYQTILKVANLIAEQQQEFFNQGPQHLSPLNLQMVADQLGMHQSTISRVITNKYIATPFGTYSLKFFFSAEAKSDDAGKESLSANAVKDWIKDMIAHEDARAPLSDQKISEKLLAENGIRLARRTVAKYRIQMRIADAASRRLVW